jgi:hypothetical protein
MEAALHAISRRPLIVCSVILAAFVLGLWGVHAYVVGVVQPRQRLALLDEVRTQVKDADEKLKLRQFAPALSTYQLILKTRDADLRPTDKGRLHYQAALSVMGLAQGENEKQNLMRAEGHLNDALQFRTLAADPDGYAETQAALGEVLLRRRAAEQRPELFDQALSAFQEALKAVPADRSARAHAQVQIQIGNAYREAFASGDGQKDENMAPALTAYENASRAATAAADPVAAAQAQLERGRAYLKLAAGVFKRTNTRLAMANFEAALQVFGQKSHPQDFGRLQELMGDTYTKMAKEVKVETDNQWRATQIRYDWEASAQRAYALAAQFGAHQASSNGTGK